MVRLPPVVMSAKSATARTTIAREDAEDHQVKLSAQKLEELLASTVSYTHLTLPTILRV